MDCCNNKGLEVAFRHGPNAQSQSSEYFPVPQGFRSTRKFGSASWWRRPVSHGRLSRSSAKLLPRPRSRRPGSELQDSADRRCWCAEDPLGKILCGTMRKIAAGENYSLLATIDDPAVVAAIDRALATAGYAER